MQEPEIFLFFTKNHVVEDIQKVNPDLILICANSVDTARVIQYLRLKNVNTKVASSEWAITNEFVQNGGKSIEGVLFNIDYDSNSTSPRYMQFAKAYEKKYKVRPSMFASKGYELTD